MKCLSITVAVSVLVLLTLIDLGRCQNIPMPSWLELPGPFSASAIGSCSVFCKFDGDDVR